MVWLIIFGVIVGVAAMVVIAWECSEDDSIMIKATKTSEDR